MRFFSTASILICVLSANLHAQTRVSVKRHEPGNVFDLRDPVHFEAKINGVKEGDSEFAVSVTNYSEETVWKKTFAVHSLKDQPTDLSIDVGQLGPGYYEMAFGPDVEIVGVSKFIKRITFGVAASVNRSAVQVRDGKFRFGLKKWGSGDPVSKDSWSPEEAVNVSTKLGLQWTRELFNQAGTMGINDMVARYPMNVVLKVERFPAELYDSDRYGPMPEWEAKFGRGQWKLKTLPKKGPYEQWLREQIKAIPPEQKVFEIWNEPWDKMSPEDFATLCHWIVPVIKELRPDAIIGPDLLGDTSPYQFDARFLKAGGMDGMNMVVLHPYGVAEDRAFFDRYRSWHREQSGRDIEIYVTEFGSHSVPQGPAKRSEREQAQRIVRQALCLYAADVSIFMPHWMGQSEKDPTYIEDWFGLMRFNRQPKPALIAYANAARLIDGSRYVGELWYGPGNDALLFERDGVYTLAIYTRGEAQQINVPAGAGTMDVVDMVGKSKSTTAATDGNLKLNIGPDVTYVVGVSPSLKQSASKTVRGDRWPKPPVSERITRIAHILPNAPKIDGQLDDWKDALEIALQNQKVAGDDASAIAQFAWDEENLYVALHVRDNEVLNTQPRAKLYRQDCLELFITTKPRSEGAGFGPDDHQFFLTPTSGEGKPIFGEVLDRSAGVVADVKGVQFASAKWEKGWNVEAAIPWESLKAASPKDGDTFGMDMQLSDADTSHERFKLLPIDSDFNGSSPATWSLLMFKR